MDLTLDTLRPPDAAARAEITALAGRVAERDGAPPLSDQALSRIGAPGPVHRVARRDGRLCGYAQLDGSSLEIAAEPDAAEPLLAAIETLGTPGLAVWSHGRDSVLGPVLARRGYHRERVLHRLRRGLGDLPAPAPVPVGVTVRTFEAGRDEDAWLALNAAAFAAHAEQGGWTRADLDARIGEEWFDAAGLFLAEQDGDLVGFHWTKIHPDGTGEVYVVAVSPAAQGTGLGRALVDLGLRHLADRGCPSVILYVDESNTPAMRLYEKLGFGSDNVDIQWTAP